MRSKRRKRRTNKMILFSDRHTLAQHFQIWAEKNGVNKEPEAVIAFLVNQGLINEEKYEKWKEEHND